MRVLHVISDRNIGGAGILLLNLLWRFDPEQVESVVALPQGGQLRPRVLQTGTPVVELENVCNRLSAASVWELVRVIHTIQPDLVHTSAAISARLAAKLCGKKVLYTRHCAFAPKPVPLRTLRNVCNNILCDGAVATARAAADDLRELGVPQKKIWVIPNGCEEVRKTLPFELELCRTKYGIAAGDFCVGICARLEPCKGHDVFLHAAKMAIDAMPEISFRFLVIGDGSRRKFLEELAGRLAIAEWVVFTGFVEDVAPLYRIMQIHVNCSVGTETSCLAVSEGMSAGLPTILSDYGGNCDMLGDSGAGYCLPQKNAPAVAEAICRLAACPELRTKMGENARKRYEQNYTADRMAKQLTAVYRNLLR